MRTETHAFRQVKVGFFEVAFPTQKKEPQHPMIVVVLHGQGSTPAAVLSSVSPALSMSNAIAIAPPAPHVHEEQMLAGKIGWRAWPMAWARWSDDGFPRDDVLALGVPGIVMESIAGCIAEARRRYAVDNREVVMVGHSEGATYAVAFASQNPNEVRACYAYAGGPYDHFMQSESFAEGLKTVGLRVVHHREDDENRFEGSADLCAFLTEHGVEHSTHFTEGTDHSVSDDIVADMREFVERFV